ncbi:Uncharacterised protein [uncultured archaeon]|nr:Uncharacterised protein [uncultured archaeon]
MLCPFLLTTLSIEISFLSTEKVLSELSITISTFASFAGAAALLPKKIKFPALTALIDFMLNLPRTKHNASEILLLPLPFAPTITLIPGASGISVLLTKLLNPCITSFLR